ncbi:hypothetical protein PIB30_036972 [Stylosanthes scabra]|uniref:Uncharacterized protein n=1 Tax=Stylosanthes scabra TaxID=79078 RepID=A0ABU6XB99_9FABA|nr:hypothetical protein [Stylosanthes scabra]
MNPTSHAKSDANTVGSNPTLNPMVTTAFLLVYDLLVELYEAQEREKGSGDSQSEEESDVEDEIEEVETDDEHDKTFFIATLFNNKSACVILEPAVA